MKYDKAKQDFKRVLDEQQTVSVLKLRKLMQTLNMNLEPSKDAEVAYLKGEIKKLTIRNNQLERKLSKRRERG